MTTKKRYTDHKSKNSKLIHWILFAVNLVTLVVLIPTFFGTGVFEEDPFLVGFFLVIFIAFFISPHIFLYLFQKPKWTEFDPETRIIYLREKKVTLRTIPFDQVQFLSFSEYTYTVKTKNGSRTVTVFTVLGHLDEGTVPFAESTNFPEVRLFGESIAKILKTSLQNESKELIPYTELDLPIHKRKVPKEILDSEITFLSDSTLIEEKTNQESKLFSKYNPKIFVFVSFTVSITLTLIFHFVIGSAFEFSIETWESFPPTMIQMIFLILSFVIGFLPLTYVWWNYKKRKEIRITKDIFYWNQTEYRFQDWEEILLKEHTLYIINDTKTKSHSLFFFCLPSDYLKVRNWIIKEIFLLSGGNADLSRF
ncbi:hypothetical protein [Leptospira kanakyensis]|uniref:hypothetical protein n=1 Tax=Leptospira kanakyensis TaxID=2484968 RepID=UPI00223CF5F8|nr:hypothetical protein [Leptospira kanakyensis]MCW7471244.1 chloride channel protein [Leptospira kanakyensis]